MVLWGNIDRFSGRLHHPYFPKANPQKDTLWEFGWGRIAMME
jgi:hypothetical protein